MMSHRRQLVEKYRWLIILNLIFSKALLLHRGN